MTVNYGSSERIRSLFTSLVAHSPRDDFELIVVDNASPGDDFENLNKIFDQEERVKVVGLPENLGFGGGNREGVALAKGEILVIINPDIEVQEGTLDQLQEVLESDDSIGIVTPQLENPDGTYQYNARNFPSVWGLMKHRIMGNKAATKEYFRKDQEGDGEVVEIDWAQGSFLMMKKAFFDQLGGFDERFFLFFEDMDLCRRCWEAGKKVVKVNSARATHGADRLSGGTIFQAIRKKTFWIHLDSARKYFWKYKSKKLPRNSSGTSC